MQNDNTLIESVKLLISRLERLSVDSHWAHRASGLRGSLWHCVEELEALDKSQCNCDLPRFEHLMAQGYEILESAAREIIAPEK